MILYTDPGTGSIVLQVAWAALAASAVWLLALLGAALFQAVVGFCIHNALSRPYRHSVVVARGLGGVDDSARRLSCVPVPR
jgi:hypothetical protein